MGFTRSILAALSLFGLSCGAAIAVEQTVKVAGDPYPPWALGEEGKAPSGGIAVEITQELFQRMGMQSRAMLYPFKRGLERIRSGEEDVILMVSRSAERKEYMLFSEPVREVKFVFYHAGTLKQFDWQDWADLKPYRIGVVSGYNLGDDWKTAVEEHGLKVEEVKTDIFNIKKVLLGRVDIILTDHEVMQEIINTTPEYQGKLEWHAKPVFEAVNNLGISRRSSLAPQLPEINAVMRDMKKDGTFQRIFCAHGKPFNTSCD